MSHRAHSAGTAVEWQLDVVIDIYLWISTESGSIVTRVLFNFSLLNAAILARIDLRPPVDKLLCPIVPTRPGFNGVLMFNEITLRMADAM